MVEVIGDRNSAYRGAISSKDLQYARKASDFQCPNILTTSGRTPHRRSSVVPPIQNECLVELGYVFAIQMVLQHARNLHVVRQTWPLLAQYKNKSSH